MENSLLSLVSNLLNISKDEVNKNCKIIDEIDAYYFWNPIKGG